MNKLTSIVAIAFVALGGCAFDTGSESSSVPTLYQRLGTRETLTLEAPNLVGVAAYDKQGQPIPCLQPNIVGGEAVLRATDEGVVLVEALDIELSDILIEQGVVSETNEIRLVDIQLRLGTPLSVIPEWTNRDTRAVGTGKADLLMDWSLLADNGDRLPLATQRMRDVEFFVEARLRTDHRVTVAVTTAVEGTIWDLGRIELSDFSMAINASTVPSIQ